MIGSFYIYLNNLAKSAFISIVCPNDKYSLLNLKLSQNVKIVKTKKHLHWAVESIFNIPEEILIKISKQPFVICYRKYIRTVKKSQIVALTTMIK